jgi:hypothetical protein
MGPDNANGSTLRTSKLYLEYKVLATAAAQASGTQLNALLTLTVNHPYAAVDPSGSAAGSYMDGTITRTRMPRFVTRAALLRREPIVTGFFL